MFADEVLELGCIADLMPGAALPDSLQDLGRGLRANVGGNQRVLQLIENAGIDFLAAADRVFKLFDQTGASLLNAGLETLKKVGLARRGRAEERLDHEGAENSILTAPGAKLPQIELDPAVAI